MTYPIGAKIRYFRELRNLSQKEFSQLIGVNNTRVSNWETGTNRPDADIIAAICKVLQISADELLDIHLPKENLTDEEKKVISQYREKPELRHAIRILLGLEHP